MVAPPPCTLAVDGLPRSARTSHHLESLGGVLEVPDGELPLRFDAPAIRVRLTGERFRGSVLIRQSECKDGRIFRLKAHPKPAKLRFRCSPSEMVVRCLNCADRFARWHLESDFPPVPMKSFTRDLVLEFKAPGFHRGLQKVMIIAGPNDVEVAMKPLDPG